MKPSSVTCDLALSLKPVKWVPIEGVNKINPPRIPKRSSKKLRATMHLLFSSCANSQAETTSGLRLHLKRQHYLGGHKQLGTPSKLDILHHDVLDCAKIYVYRSSRYRSPGCSASAFRDEYMTGALPESLRTHSQCLEAMNYSSPSFTKRPRRRLKTVKSRYVGDP